MISVDQALQRVLDTMCVLEAIGQPLEECLGQVLAEDVLSGLDVPPLDDAAMDGYALRGQDISLAGRPGGATLRVIGEVAAGYIFGRTVGAGEAVRIMTGAPVPPGADTVVQFEHTDEVARRSAGKPLDEITVLQLAEVGLNIRRAGENIARGQRVLVQGTLLRAQEIGVLASLGRSRARVHRRPLVAVLATGDELVEPGTPLSPGKIYDANSYSVSAQVSRYGGIPKRLGIARDNVADLSEKIRSGWDCDLFISSAGVSTGEYDVVKNVLAQQGQIAFWTVAMKPGKPLAFGTLRAGERRIPYLGLPGNMVSSMVAFEQFARPAILKMLGRRSLDKPTVRAVSECGVRNSDGRRVYVRVVVTERGGRYYARSAGPQGSGILTSMSRANGLMVVPETVAEMKEGDEAGVQMLDWDLGE